MLWWSKKNIDVGMKNNQRGLLLGITETLPDSKLTIDKVQLTKYHGYWQLSFINCQLSTRPDLEESTIDKVKLTYYNTHCQLSFVNCQLF